MSLNCVEIQRLLEHFPQRGIIRKFFQPDKTSLILNIFDGTYDFYVYVDIKDRYNRICLVQKKDFENKVLRFGQMLNGSYAMSRLTQITQYEYARIIIIECEANNTPYRLILRLWGAGSNMILLDKNDIIIDCIRRMPKRGEWPGEEFLLPESKAGVQNQFTVRNEFDVPDISNAVFTFYKTIIDNDKYDRKYHELNQLLTKEKKVILKTLVKIGHNLREDREQRYHHYGELLKAYIYKLKKGLEQITVEDYDTGENVTIPLAADRAPQDNVTYYFDKYKKIKHGRIKWEQEKARAEIKLDIINTLIERLEGSNTYSQLVHLDGKIVKKLNKKIILDKEVTKKELPGRKYTLDGNFKAFISRSAKEADQILKRVAKGNDYWFHIRDEAGSHIIVKQIKGKELTEKARLEAATLALFYSKARGEADADIYFARVKHLHRSKGGPAGLVFPTQEKNIKVIFKDEILQEIFNRSK